MVAVEQNQLVRGHGFCLFSYNTILQHCFLKNKKVKQQIPFLLDIPLRQVIAEECVAFLLNWCENEYLTMQVPLPLVQTNPYVKVRSAQSQSFLKL